MVYFKLYTCPSVCRFQQSERTDLASVQLIDLQEGVGSEVEAGGHFTTDTHQEDGGGVIGKSVLVVSLIPRLLQ